MKLYLRASAFSLFLHTVVVFGAFLYCRSGESPGNISAEYLTATAVSIISENLEAETASGSADMSPISEPSAETPVKPVLQNIVGTQKPAPLRITAGQRKTEHRSVTAPDYKKADTVNEHTTAEAAPTGEMDDPTPQSPTNPAGGADLSSATLSDDPKKAKVTEGIDAPAVKTQYIQTNYEYIREIIARNVSFPASARKRRLRGKIEVSFLVGTEGSVADIRIISSSGHALLDRNVIEAVRRSAPFPASPELARIALPIAFRLK